MFSLFSGVLLVMLLFMLEIIICFCVVLSMIRLFRLLRMVVLRCLMVFLIGYMKRKFFWVIVLFGGLRMVIILFICVLMRWVFLSILFSIFFLGLVVWNWYLVKSCILRLGRLSILRLVFIILLLILSFMMWFVMRVL